MVIWNYFNSEKKRGIKSHSYLTQIVTKTDSDHNRKSSLNLKL